MTTTLRDILRKFADTGNLDAEYVPASEYEALQAILKRWTDWSPALTDSVNVNNQQVQSDRLINLIAATKAALEE